MAADDQGAGQGDGSTYLLVKDAIDDEARAAIRKLRERFGKRAVSFSWDEERRRLMGLIANSIARGDTAVFQRRYEMPEIHQLHELDPVDLREDPELAAYVAGMTGYYGEDPRETARLDWFSGKTPRTFFRDANCSWMWCYVKSPVDWEIVRTGRPAMAPDELSPWGRPTYEKIIVGLMLRVGGFGTNNRKSWVTVLARLLNEEGIVIDVKSVRTVVNGNRGSGDSGAHDGLRIRLEEKLAESARAPANPNAGESGG